MVPEGHRALCVPTKAAGAALVLEPFPCLGESPPERDLRHRLTLSLPVRRQIAEQWDVGPVRCPKLRAHGLCPRESMKESGGNTAKFELCSFRMKK